MNKLEDYFWNKKKKCEIHKWHHYFEIYENHFSRFIGKNPTVLEIGVQNGGSLEMWNYFFDGECKIFGIDINEKCKNIPRILNVENIKVVVGI